ncbi:MAG: GNAT family N-acetyltransferase [Oscillospiraceae bacterium]|nr:GNAT family N-acetyltransferase [Oscillospiraceae bacterium]
MDGFDIRYARGGDAASVRALWALCFPGEAAFAEYFFARLYRPERALLAVGPDGPAAMLHIMPFEMAWLGQTVPVGYVYGVGTHPAFRRRGLAAGLLDQALFEMHLRGCTFAALIPQEAWLFDFYRPFGFAAVFRRPTVGYAAPGGVHTARAADIEALNRRYEIHLARRPHLLRTQAHWENILEECALAGGRVLMDDADGYAVYADGSDVPVECFGAGAAETGPACPFGCLRVVQAGRALAMAAQAGRRVPDAELRDACAPWNNGRLTAVGGCQMDPSDLAVWLFDGTAPYMQLMHN